MTIASKSSPTYDKVAEYCLEILVRGGALPRQSFTPDWNAFSRLSRKVHERFHIPSTTFTPIMRHLLFLLASYKAPRAIVGAGIYVGYTFAWLIRDAEDCPRTDAPQSIIGLDVDEDAIAIARQNCALLNHGKGLSLLKQDALEYLHGRVEPIDCLYVDIDAPNGRKDAYVDVLAAAAPRLTSGALVLAHDPCIAAFAQAFKSYHGLVERDRRLRGPWILPVDACGLSIVTVR